MYGFFSYPSNFLRDAFTTAGDNISTAGFIFLFTVTIGIGIVFYLVGTASGQGAEDDHMEEWEGDHELERDVRVPMDKDFIDEI